jgi:hypothetical protein
VEHAFALITNCLKAEHLRYIGQKRTTAAVPLTNFLHNILRVSQLRTLAVTAAYASASTTANLLFSALLGKLASFPLP